MSLSSYERYPLLLGPSPVHRLERLTEHLGGAALWAKREDLNSGIAYGGNKTRKLEYLVADALAQGCDTLVSIGGVQSNHTRQVAAVAARAGLKCVLVQESWVDWPDAVYDKVGNILVSPARRGRRTAGAGRVRDRLQGELGAGAPGGRGRGRQALRHPGRRLRPPAGRPGLRRVGVRGRRAGTGTGRLLRHGRRLLGDRLHPGGHDRRFPRAGGGGRPYPAGDRRRRVRRTRPHPGADRPDRAPHGPAHRGDE